MGGVLPFKHTVGIAGISSSNLAAHISSEAILTVCALLKLAVGCSKFPCQCHFFHDCDSDICKCKGSVSGHYRLGRGQKIPSS